MKHVWLPLVAALAIAACATPTPEPAEAPAAEPPAPIAERGKVCRKESLAGSNVVRRVCRTHERVAAEQEQARRAMGRSGTNVPDKMPGT